MRVYNLLKQELVKKLQTNCKWVSSMAVHPAGKSLSCLGYCVSVPSRYDGMMVVVGLAVGYPEPVVIPRSVPWSHWQAYSNVLFSLLV